MLTWNYKTPPRKPHIHKSKRKKNNKIPRRQVENFRCCSLGNLCWLEVNKRVEISSLTNTDRGIKLLGVTQHNLNRIQLACCNLISSGWVGLRLLLIVVGGCLTFFCLFTTVNFQARFSNLKLKKNACIALCKCILYYVYRNHIRN